MSTHRDRLEQYGVPVDSLDALFDERLRGLTQSVQGFADLTSKYGADFQARGHQMLELAQSDPHYSAMAAADPVGAAEYAYLRCRTTMPAPAVSHPARMPQSQQSLGYGMEAVHARDAEQSDKRAYIKQRLRSVISDEFLNQ